MRAWVMVLSTAILGALFMGVLRVPGLSALAIVIISDGGQLAAAVLAAVACALAARRVHGHRRRAWLWMSVGTGSWAAGQAVWSYYEVFLNREVPFPSAADIGFLAFPLAAAVGLVTWLGTQEHQRAARGRDLLDGTLIACSLLVLSWVTTLGTVLSDGGALFPLLLSLAYPVGDLVLATLVLFALARANGIERTTFAILALGLGGLALADSAYVYLVSIGSYSSANLISSGWVIGFLLVGVAALSLRPDHAYAVDWANPAHDATMAGEPTPRPSLLRLTLPYVPLLAAGSTLCTKLVRAHSAVTVELLLGVLLVIIVLTRQFLAMTDNQRLMTELAAARDQLQHLALHDSLTGLPNRMLFADRLDRALLRPDARISVLFCDLDDFKSVNDEQGHEAGDAMLRHVAKSLLACVRVTDTVARLGGDEFAILLEDARDALDVANRVVDSMRKPVQIDQSLVTTSVSVGIAHFEGSTTTPAHDARRRTPARRRSPVRAATAPVIPADQRETTAVTLMRHADAAMYAAKEAGKSRVVLAAEVLGASSIAIEDLMSSAPMEGAQLRLNPAG